MTPPGKFSTAAAASSWRLQGASPTNGHSDDSDGYDYDDAAADKAEAAAEAEERRIAAEVLQRCEEVQLGYEEL